MENKNKSDLQQAAEEFVKNNPSGFNSFDLNNAKNDGKEEGFKAGASWQKSQTEEQIGIMKDLLRRSAEMISQEVEVNTLVNDIQTVLKNTNE